MGVLLQFPIKQPDLSFKVSWTWEEHDKVYTTVIKTLAGAKEFVEDMLDGIFVVENVTGTHYDLPLGEGAATIRKVS